MAAEQSAQRLAETKDVYVSLSTRATIIEQEHETQTAVLRANLSEAQLVVQRLRPENVVDVSVPLQQGKLGVSLSDDAVVLSTKGVSAAAGLPVGSRVLSVDGVAVSTKAETIGHVKRLTTVGAASMVLMVELSLTPVASTAHPLPTLVSNEAAASSTEPLYTCVSKATLRGGIDITTKKVGLIEMGAVVQV